MDPLTLAMLGSTALSAFGSLQAGKADKKASYEKARFKESAAAEMRNRAIINKRALATKAMSERSEAVQNITSSGFTADSSLSLLNASFENEMLARMNIDRETDYEVAMLKAEADSLRRSGKAAETAGMFKAGGSILDGAYDFQKAGGSKGMEDRMAKSSGSGLSTDFNDGGLGSFFSSLPRGKQIYSNKY